MFQPNVEDGGDKGNGREKQEIQQKRERETMVMWLTKMMIPMFLNCRNICSYRNIVTLLYWWLCGGDRNVWGTVIRNKRCKNNIFEN